MEPTEAGPEPQSTRDVDLLELQLQNAATWHVLDNAIQLRELTVRLHGAAVGLTPFAIGLLDVDVVLYSGALALAFLAVVSLLTFRNLDVLRLLQFRLAVEEGRARVRLRSGHRTYATEKSLRPPTLRRQNDPMGITTRSVLGVTAFDTVAFGIVGGLALTNESADNVRLIALLIGGASGAVGALAMWAISMRQSQIREIAVSADMHEDPTSVASES
jgi:hypothetical protein